MFASAVIYMLPSVRIPVTLKPNRSEAKTIFCLVNGMKADSRNVHEAVFVVREAVVYLYLSAGKVASHSVIVPLAPFPRHTHDSRPVPST